MAMEKLYVLRETHTRSITALGYNPYRREILMGCEDGVIKVWEAEGAKLVHTAHEHRGWITDFLFWGDPRLMLSAANDGYIIAWAAGGAMFDRIQIGLPVYCMTINPRRHQLICGVNGSIIVFDLDENKECGHIINLATQFVAREHSDIVRCVVCADMRVYSGGYDQKFIVYDSSYSGNKAIKPLIMHKEAHDAGITCLIVAKDNENNTWVVTGSFDKSVKVWTSDGKLVHKLEGFINTVTGVCYVPKNKTIWAVGGTGYALLFDPKSGDNVSDFIGTFQTQEEEKYQLQVLKYFPELNQVVASTSRRHLIVWKYISSGCQTALKLRYPIESLCYTKKVPLLLFSGDHSGAIVKWERMQANHFMYSKETMIIQDATLKETLIRESKTKSDGTRIELDRPPSPDEREKDKSPKVSRFTTKHTPTSHYAFNKPTIPAKERRELEVSQHEHPHTTILKILFVEDFDYILAASEDTNIYVWGFDELAVKVLKNMKPEGQEDLVAKYSILLDSESNLLPKNQRNGSGEEDSVTNRVAGFICKHILAGHNSCVTSMVVVGKNAGFNNTYLLSGSWDRRINVWDLNKGKLVDAFRNRSGSTNYDHVETACDGVITDMAYNKRRNEFAYSSTDKMVYIRKFSTKGIDMLLQNTLQGHDGEVTAVTYSEVTDKWVTGSEDGTIRIWSTEGMNECEQVLSAQGAVCTLIVDTLNGSIVAGVQEFIRVYDPEKHRLVQTNVGHTDAVRSIIHVPERNQYISSSWDKTIRIWNTWKMPKRKPDENAAKKNLNRKTSVASEAGSVIKLPNNADNTAAEEAPGDKIVEETEEELKDLKDDIHNDENDRNNNCNNNLGEKTVDDIIEEMNGHGSREEGTENGTESPKGNQTTEEIVGVGVEVV